MRARSDVGGKTWCVGASQSQREQISRHRCCRESLAGAFRDPVKRFVLLIDCRTVWSLVHSLPDSSCTASDKAC